MIEGKSYALLVLPAALAWWWRRATHRLRRSGRVGG